MYMFTLRNESVMKLELISIISNNGAALNFDNDLTFEKTEFLGSVYEFSGPLHAVGKIENISGSLLLTAKVNGKIKSECARCKKPLEVDISYDMREILAQNESDEEDAVVLEGTLFDLSEAVLSNFYINVPSKILCSPDCKGLCPHCGANRNETVCECEEDNIDPRLAVIDDLFKD